MAKSLFSSPALQEIKDATTASRSNQDISFKGACLLWLGPRLLASDQCLRLPFLHRTIFLFQSSGLMFTFKCEISFNRTALPLFARLMGRPQRSQAKSFHGRRPTQRLLCYTSRKITEHMAIDYAKNAPRASTQLQNQRRLPETQSWHVGGTRWGLDMLRESDKFLSGVLMDLFAESFGQS